MTQDVVSLLKGALGKKNFVEDFEYRLGNYQGDFLWTRDQMLALWKYCSEFIERKEYNPKKNKVVQITDYFFQLALVACREKMLRSIDTNDRNYWRVILAQDGDEKAQKLSFERFLMDKRGKVYLAECKKAFDAAAKRIKAEIKKFVKDLEQPAVDFLEKFGMLCTTFSAAIENGNNWLLNWP